MRAASVALFIVASLLPAAARQTSIEIDRTLVRIDNTSIMTSDVRQARLLRLLPDAGTDNATIQTALENRVLILKEVARVTLPEPTPAAIDARRATWTATWSNPSDLPALMTRAGMSDQALSGWFRDDLKISAYLDQRFGLQRDESRAKRLADWIAGLRNRANLIARYS
jgi:hypothetical protein